jgi:hypothetical protein
LLPAAGGYGRPAPNPTGGKSWSGWIQCSVSTYRARTVFYNVLGVIMRNDMKCNSQCIKAVKTANRVLGMIKRTFTVRDKSIMLQLYKSLVRPHVEYSVQAFS